MKTSKGNGSGNESGQPNAINHALPEWLGLLSTYSLNEHVGTSPSATHTLTGLWPTKTQSANFASLSMNTFNPTVCLRSTAMSPAKSALDAMRLSSPKPPSWRCPRSHEEQQAASPHGDEGQEPAPRRLALVVLPVRLAEE